MASSSSRKVLDLNWNPHAETLHFNPTKIIASASTTKSPTKRQILQISARTFAPVCFLSPVTVVTKMMFQELWDAKLN